MIKYRTWNNRDTGCVDLHSKRMGVMPMKNHFDFKDLLTFGLFLLALLTFVFTFCKKFYIEKPPLKLWRVKGGISISLLNWSNHLVGGCSFVSII